ncbi:STAS domain-containing protein [uncultured Chloroflexus sp.]|uniref:STAS domain-containing protein n=1 Tax=uncultured Chloroflexus sp. TaxID=214040 RepID=UPI0026198EBD|nr:STAS domain-containing protein [uncultured Chloroflexus sp.]
MLSSLWNWFLAVPTSDAELQRRGRNLLIIGVVLVVMSVLSIPLVLIQPDPLPQLIANLFGLALVVAIIVVARLGWVDQATIGLIIILVVSFAVIPFGTGQIGLVPIFAVVAVVTAAVIGRESHVVFAAGAGIVGMVSQWFGVSMRPQVAPSAGEIVVVGILLTVVCGLIASIGTRSVQRAIEVAATAQMKAEGLAQQLVEANQALEIRVAERTAALQAALAESEQRQAALAAALAENERQRREIRDLSVPILAVRDDTLVMPLIGMLDGERLALAQQRALHAIEQQRARSLLVDITGVPFVDQAAAHSLVALARSVRLLGARLTLIGVSPEVAQTIIGLGIELHDMSVARDLRDAVMRGSTPSSM